MSRKLAFNIRGVHYETYEETLMRFPNTLLGNPQLRAQFCNPEKNEFYFDRSHYIFDTILFFYQSGGILAKPEHIDEDDFQDELRFFGIIKDPVAVNPPATESLRIKRKLWLLLEYPKSSLAAKILANFSLFIIIFSTITYCLETVDSSVFRIDKKNRKKIGELPFGSPWTILESIYVIWFSLEYILRLSSQPKRKTFIFSTLGIVDLIAIIPYFIIVFVIKHKSKAAVRFCRFLQIFRILKLTRYSKSLQLLGKSLYYCKGQISLLLVFFFINCFACGSILYWIEKNSSNIGIMNTMWFCVISMTTVGYGDIVPQTALGKVMGAVTILIGIIVLFHIFIPVYLSYFALLYELSVLNQVEKEELEKEQDPKPEAKKVRKITTDVSGARRPRPSVSMSRSPSVCTREGFSPARKQSTAKEETFMRKIKYDYLRKVSSTEAPVDLSTWRSSSYDSDTNESSKSLRSVIRKRTILDSPGSTDMDREAEEINVVKDMAQKAQLSAMRPRGRRKAVIDQPNIFAELYDDSRQLPTSFNTVTKPCRSASVTDQPTGILDRKFSAGNEGKRFLQVHRKALSLQLFNLEQNDLIEEPDSSSDLDL